MKTYEGLKPWSLFFALNGFINELIGPQTNNINLSITWGQTMSQEMLKILIIGLNSWSKAGLSCHFRNLLEDHRPPFTSEI